MYTVSPRVVEACLKSGCTVLSYDEPFTGKIVMQVLHVFSNMYKEVHFSSSMMYQSSFIHGQSTHDIFDREVLHAMQMLCKEIIDHNFPYSSHVTTDPKINKPAFPTYSPHEYRELIRRIPVNKEPYWCDMYQVNKVICHYQDQTPSYSATVDLLQNEVTVTVSVVAYGETRIRKATDTVDLSTGGVILLIIKLVDELKEQYFGV
jgi:folate-binding Fe-S cluster repair protein YgfZ